MPRRCSLLPPPESAQEDLQALLDLRDRAQGLLTDRQREILNYLIRDLTQFRIAQICRITTRMVEYEVAAIKKAIGEAHRQKEAERVEGLVREGVTIQLTRKQPAWREDRTGKGRSTIPVNWPVQMIVDEPKIGGHVPPGAGSGISRSRWKPEPGKK